MNRKPKTAARVATGVGLTVGGVALAATALYTEIMTTIIARRRSPLADTLMVKAAGRKSDAPSQDEASAEAGTATETSSPAVEETNPVAAAAEALLNAPTELVELRSRDGYVLRAHWYPAENARRTVILAHGWHSRWNRDFSVSSPVLHDHGCNLLLIEQRCHGQSGGNLISYGILERYDILSWLDWLEANHAGYPVYLCGISMGAATVLMAAGLPIAGRVRGIIADCGYSTPQEIVKITLEKNIGKLAGPTLAAVNLNCKLREDFTLGDYTPIEAMTQNTEIPCLFIHGDADDFVPWRMSVENYYACQAPKDLLIVHGAGHGLSFLVDPETYTNKVLAFFEAYDTPVVLPEPKKKRFGHKKPPSERQTVV